MIWTDIFGFCCCLFKCYYFHLFLFSFRVLIDELAKGRAVLSSQYQESQDAIQRLLNERHELQSHLTESYRCVLPNVYNEYDIKLNILS